MQQNSKTKYGTDRSRSRNRSNEWRDTREKTAAVSQFMVCTLQGPSFCGLGEGVYFGVPCRPHQLLLKGTVYPSQHFLVVSPDVAAPTCMSLFMQPRSAKVTRTVKFDRQIRVIPFLILFLHMEED